MSYKRPSLLLHAHLETIYPALFRKVNSLLYTRERITTPDDDFLDLDWLVQDSSRLVILSHGLEGNSSRAYIRGMGRQFYTNHYDVLAWNYRSCSEEINRQKRFYHSGATDDLDVVVKHALSKKYQEIILIGFSLGGNLTLKYLGEAQRDSRITKAITFSVPLNLRTSCEKISEPSNSIYAQRFLKSLKTKVISKAALRTDLDISGIASIRTLKDFDDRYTSVLHGFSNAIEYYEQCSSVKFVEHISIPTLIVNAQNDPFLSKDCFPVDLLAKHPKVVLEITTHGGHVGFTQFGKKGVFWSEERALHFASNQ